MRVLLAIFVLVSAATRSQGSGGDSFLQVGTRRHAATPESAGSCANLVEEGNGTHYTLTVMVGTPGQSFSVVADTGSNSLIIPSCVCKEQGSCGNQDRCFRGTNRSSTFKLDKKVNGNQELLISFGSGQIGAIVARDVAQVGSLRVDMNDGLLLMVENALRIGGKFEGILGLGSPSKAPPPVLSQVLLSAPPGQMPSSNSAEDDIMEALKKMLDDAVAGAADGDVAGAGAGAGAASSQGMRNGGHHTAKSEPVHVTQPKGFLEQANVDRFSMCFENDGSGGILRMGLPPLQNDLQTVGHDHWALDFRGISVGKGSKAVEARFCSPANKTNDMETACGIIPDSGTTAIMGPKLQLVTLMEDLCDRWDRCSTNHTKMKLAADAATNAASKVYGFDPFGFKSLGKAELFETLLMDCASWLDEGSLDELPPLMFHVAGNDGKEDILEIPSSAYLIEMDTSKLATNYTSLVSNVPVGTVGGATHAASSTAGAKKACLASFGAMEYPTKKNGDVWILGVPLFLQYQVSYDLKAKQSGSMSFTKLQEGVGCGSCPAAAHEDKKRQALLASGSQHAARRKMRRLTGPSRIGPHIDVTRPL